MDIVGSLQWLFGMGADRHRRVADRRNELARLSAEISAEVAKVQDVLDFEIPKLLAKCDRIFPGDVAIREALLSSTREIHKINDQLSKLVQANRQQMDSASSFADWDALLRGYYEWRGTASRLGPWIEGTIQKYHAILDEEDHRQQSGGT